MRAAIWTIRSLLLACALGALLLVAWIAASYTIDLPAPTTKLGAPAAGQKQQQPPAAAAPAPQQPLPVSPEQALFLVRSTLLTLNDANRSGNYGVMRDLAAPDFQARNTAADLAQIFADLRRRNFDLYGVALLAPELAAAPALDAEKRLHLTGFFPTRPQQIDFDLSFEVVGGQWRLFGIAVATPEAPPLAPQTGRPAAPAPKGR
jgi:hypothetical protein